MISAQNRIDLRPRPQLLKVLLALFCVWIGLLLWMYFATVYPMRHPGKSSAPASLPTTNGE